MNIFRLLILIFVIAGLAACGSPEDRATQYLTAAEEYLAQDKLVKARLEAQNAAQIEPRNIDVRLLLAKIEEQDANIRGAARHWLIVIDEAPNNIEARLKLGNFFILGQADEVAREHIDAAMAVAPGNAEVRLLNARIIFLEGRKADAFAENEIALQLDPGLAAAIVFKSGLLADRGDIEAAFNVIDAGIAKSSREDSAELRFFRLQLLQSPGFEDQIEDELRSLINDFPEQTSYSHTLVNWYVQAGRLDAAEQVIRQLIADHPDDMAPKVTLLNLLLFERDEKSAETGLKALIAEDPNGLSMRMALGVVYEKYNRFDDAYKVYENVAERSALSVEGMNARNRMVAIDLMREDIDSARTLVSEILRDEPVNTKALMVRAEFYFTEQDYDAAIADLRIVLRNSASSERALRLLANAYVGNGSRVLAVDVYRQILALTPGDQQASAELAALFNNEGDADAATEVLRDRLAVVPEDVAATGALIKILLAQQDIDGAEREARRLVDLDQEITLAYIELARVLVVKGSVDEAIVAYKYALELDPDAIQALQGLVTLLVNNDRANEAFDTLVSHVDRNPEQLDARILLGSLYGLRGESEAARAEYETIIASQPDTAAAYLGLAGLEAPNSAAQVVAFQRGYAANPNDLRLTLLLTRALEHDQRYEESIAIYEEQLARNPDHMVIVNNLAALLLDQRDDTPSHQRALNLIEQHESSSQPVILDTIGWAHYRNGNYTNAVRYLERAVAGGEQMHILHYHLGMAYAKSNNLVGAKQALTRALELSGQDFPGSDEARATLKQLEE